MERGCLASARRPRATEPKTRYVPPPEAFGRAKVKPRRSPSDLAKTAAVLNFDGIGTEIMGPIKSMVAYGAPLSSLGPMFFEVARAPAGR